MFAEFVVFKGDNPVGLLSFTGNRSDSERPVGVYRYKSIESCVEDGLTSEYLRVGSLLADTEYVSDVLFDEFADRIPPRTRRDVLKRLQYDGISQYDDVAYMRQYNLTLMTDALNVRYLGGDYFADS